MYYKFVSMHFSSLFLRSAVLALWCFCIPGLAVAQADIELSSQLGAHKDAALQKIVDRFNAQNTGPKIVLTNRYWGEGDAAHMNFVTELDQERFLARRPLMPVWKVLQQAGESPTTLPTPRMLVASAFDAQGRAVGVPLGLGTPLMFFNKKALLAAGVDVATPPVTWLGWQSLLEKLVATGARCPFVVSQPVSTLLESTSAWHSQPLVTADQRLGERFVGNGLVQVKHVAFMATWAKARYLRYFGRGDEAESHFASGECLVMAAPSSALGSLQKAADFEIGVSSLPFHEGTYASPQNTWAGGPSLWISAGKKPAEYETIAKFVSFFLTAQNQVEWTVATGFLPLNKAGVLALQSSLLRDDVVAQRIAIAQLTAKPVTNASAATSFGHRPGVRRILAEEMESVFADKKSAKQALDNAVSRIRAGEDGCCKPLHQ